MERPWILSCSLLPSSSTYFLLWTEIDGSFSLHPFLSYIFRPVTLRADLTRKSTGESFRTSNGMPTPWSGAPFWCSVDISNSPLSQQADFPTSKSFSPLSFLHFLKMILLSARCLSKRRLVWFSKILCMLSEKQNTFYCYPKELRYDNLSSLKGKRKIFVLNNFYIYFHWMSIFFPTTVQSLLKFALYIFYMQIPFPFFIATFPRWFHDAKICLYVKYLWEYQDLMLSWYCEFRLTWSG